MFTLWRQRDLIEKRNDAMQSTAAAATTRWPRQTSGAHFSRPFAFTFWTILHHSSCVFHVYIFFSGNDAKSPIGLTKKKKWRKNGRKAGMVAVVNDKVWIISLFHFYVFPLSSFRMIFRVMVRALLYPWAIMSPDTNWYHLFALSFTFNISCKRQNDKQYLHFDVCAIETESVRRWWLSVDPRMISEDR